jgi:hypothetical protein
MEKAGLAPQLHFNTVEEFAHPLMQAVKRASTFLKQQFSLNIIFLKMEATEALIAAFMKKKVRTTCY